MVTPKLIAEELYDRASVTYQFLSTLLRKVNDKDDALQKRIGIATAVIMNLMSQKMSVFATKLGVTLVASDRGNKRTLQARNQLLYYHRSTIGFVSTKLVFTSSFITSFFQVQFIFKISKPFQYIVQKVEDLQFWKHTGI